MDTLTRDVLNALIDHRHDPSVSLFLPTHRTGGDVQQDPIRLKNLIHQAEEILIRQHHRAPEASALMAPVHALLEDETFWSHLADGLAVYRAPDFFRCFRLPVKLPELVVVADRFHINPLLPLVAGDGRFLILAISRHAVRLLQATRDHYWPVRLNGVPHNLEEARRYWENELNLGARPRMARGGGSGASLYYGHGGDAEDEKEKLSQFFRMVERGVKGFLKGNHAPVVLAGVDYELAIYRAANTYSHLMEPAVVGNPDTLSDRVLHEKAWQVMAPHFDQQRQAAAARYQELAGSKLVSHNLKQVLGAAHQGRVEVLFVPVGVQQWGTYDPIAYRAVIHPERQPGDEDLLDLTAVQTLRHQGTVYAVPPAEVPPGGHPPLAAIFRY